MGLNASNAAGGGGKIVLMEPGSYPTRLVGVVDLGLQKKPPYQGQEKPPAHMIALTYEFVDEFMLDENEQPDPAKPRWLTEMINLRHISSEKATSTARLKALDPEGLVKGDFAQLVDTPVTVTVVHNPGKGKNAGKTFENVAAVSGMRAKDAERCPPLVNKPFVFDLTDPDLEVFFKLPKFIQEKITSNLEFKGSALEKLLEDAKSDGPGAAPAEAAPDTSETKADENPY